MWYIQNLERTLQDGVVLTADWVCYSFEAGYKGYRHGFCRLPLTIPVTDPAFIPYEKLTEPTVLKWVFEALGEEGIREAEAHVKAQIELQANPVIASGLPW